MTIGTVETSGLKSFLEEVRDVLGDEVKNATPAALQVLLTAYGRGLSADQAATVFSARQAATSTFNYNEYMADVKDALRNHAFSVESEVQVLSNRIAASIQATGAVEGLLYFAHAAQELPRLRARLTVYREFLTLLHAVQESLGSAKLALDLMRADAVARLVDMREGDDSGEVAGTTEALRKVIKILDNAL